MGPLQLCKLILSAELVFQQSENYVMRGKNWKANRDYGGISIEAVKSVISFRNLDFSHGDKYSEMDFLKRVKI